MGLYSIGRTGSERGFLDAAVVSDFKKSKSGLLWSPFAEEPLVLIAPTDAPSRRAEELIAAYPFVRYSRQTWVGKSIEAFLKRRNLEVQETMSLDTLEAITTMVQNGLGVSIVPLRASDDLIALKVAGCTVFRHISASYRRNSSCARVTRKPL